MYLEMKLSFVLPDEVDSFPCRSSLLKQRKSLPPPLPTHSNYVSNTVLEWHMYLRGGQEVKKLTGTKVELLDFSLARLSALPKGEEGGHCRR